MTLHYLAYGSNLHPLRLLERVPSSQALGVVELQGFRLAFHKRGQDGSGKCNIVESDNALDSVHAALYSLAREEKPLLDAFEGAGYYVDEWQLEWQGQLIRPFIYLAEEAYIDESVPPYHWYKDIVSLGARYLQLPGDYQRIIERQVSMSDTDAQRDGMHQQLIQRIRDW